METALSLPRAAGAGTGAWKKLVGWPGLTPGMRPQLNRGAGAGCTPGTLQRRVWKTGGAATPAQAREPRHCVRGARWRGPAGRGRGAGGSPFGKARLGAGPGAWEGPHSAAGGTGPPWPREEQPHMATPVFPSSRSLGVPGNAAAPTAAKGTAGAVRARRQRPQNRPQPSSDLALRPQAGREGACRGPPWWPQKHRGPAPTATWSCPGPSARRPHRARPTPRRPGCPLALPPAAWKLLLLKAPGRPGDPPAPPPARTTSASVPEPVTAVSALWAGRRHVWPLGDRLSRPTGQVGRCPDPSPPYTGAFGALLPGTGTTMETGGSDLRGLSDREAPRAAGPAAFMRGQALGGPWDSPLGGLLPHCPPTWEGCCPRRCPGGSGRPVRPAGRRGGRT